MDEKDTTASSSLSKSKRISVGQYYKETQVAPKYNLQERNQPLPRTQAQVDRYFEYTFVPKSRLLGVCKFIESVIKASRITVDNNGQMQVTALDTSERNKNVLRPESINMNEWIASHIIIFHNYCNSELYVKHCSKSLTTMYDVKKESTEEEEASKGFLCNQYGCPSMTAGSKAEYLWADGKTVKQPTSIPAPKYIYHVLEWTSYELHESGAFPRKDNGPYSDHFLSVTAKRMLRRMFRIFAHFQCHHAEGMGEEEGKLFKAYLRQLVGLVREYKLVDSKEASVLIKSSSSNSHHNKSKKHRKHNTEETSMSRDSK